MQATGIIRRIDNLGRIVVPREIRKKLNICDGDPMELFIDGKNLVWTKCNPAGTDLVRRKEMKKNNQTP